MDPVQAQVDAYNARDIDAFVAPYAEDVVITDAGGRPIMSGVETIREEYGAMFEASPDLQAEILGRISTGDWTVDHERVSRGGETREVLVAYQVADGDRPRADAGLRRSMGWWNDRVVPRVVDEALQGHEVGELRDRVCAGCTAGSSRSASAAA